jgi:hypothetical protein
MREVTHCDHCGRRLLGEPVKYKHNRPKVYHAECAQKIVDKPKPKGE